MARNKTRIRLTAINTYWTGGYRELYMKRVLMLRTARNVGDEETVNNYVLGQLNKHQETGEISFEKIR